MKQTLKVQKSSSGHQYFVIDCQTNEIEKVFMSYRRAKTCVMEHTEEPIIEHKSNFLAEAEEV